MDYYVHPLIMWCELGAVWQSRDMNERMWVHSQEVEECEEYNTGGTRNWIIESENEKKGTDKEMIRNNEGIKRSLW